MEAAGKIKSDSAAVALRRVWESMNYSSFVEQRGLDTGKFFILRLLARDSESVQSFLEKLESLKNTAASHQNSDEAKVILSTIHSSKGLEYDRVFLLDTIDGVLPSIPKGELETPEEKKNYEEERRLYYVAMTRAKNELYLFIFTPDSSFVNESAAALPKPVYDENSIFSPLTLPRLGKSYTDKEWGTGLIEAHCEDDCFIRFSDGSLKCLSLSDMIRRRTVDYEQPLDQAKKSQSKKTQSSKKGNARNQTIIQSASELHVGLRVNHKFIGDGVITYISNERIKIRFDSYGEKEFVLQSSLDRGFLTVI